MKSVKEETSAGCLQEAKGAALGLPCMSVTRLTAAHAGPQLLLAALTIPDCSLKKTPCVCTRVCVCDSTVSIFVLLDILLTMHLYIFFTSYHVTFMIFTSVCVYIVFLAMCVIYIMRCLPVIITHFKFVRDKFN